MIKCNDEEDKFKMFKIIFARVNVGQIIVFVNKIKKIKELLERLGNENDKIRCSVLFGRMKPEDRDRTMEDFREGKTNVLISSNVIARGIDVRAVTVVVNYEIPIDLRQNSQTKEIGETFDSETLMHRIGRTGRFGSRGACISLVHDEDSEKRLQAIRKEYELEVKDFKRSDWETMIKEIEDWVGSGHLCS